MPFAKIIFQISPEIVEILIAELAEQGFDTFEETEGGLEAYILTRQFSERFIQKIVQKYEKIISIQYEIATVEKEKWNEKWGKNYDPVEVPGKFKIRATFHEPDDSYQHEIVITPKISFGTGHHSST